MWVTVSDPTLMGVLDLYHAVMSVHLEIRSPGLRYRMGRLRGVSVVLGDVNTRDVATDLGLMEGGG